jgi:GPH family glycoside/pentoside/hexuronide:cation symporter
MDKHRSPFQTARLALDRFIRQQTGGKDDIAPWKVYLYALASGAGVFLYNTFNSYLQFFYTDVVGLPSQWVGRGWFIFGFWNAINDPIAGWISDNTKAKIGRRKWYIRLLALPVALAFMLIWLPPFDVEQDGILTVFIYFLVIISIYDLIQSMITLNVDALFPEMFKKHETRLASLTVVVIIGSVLGGMAVALAPLAYKSSMGWTGMALIWALIGLALYLISLFGIEENPQYANAEETPILQRLQLAFSNRTFIIIIGLNLAFRLILAVFATSVPFYAEYVLLLDGGGTSILITSFVLSYTVSVMLWQSVYKRLGTRRALRLSLILFSFITLPTFFSNSLLTGVLTLSLVGGTLVGSLLIAAQMTFAEMIDEDFVNTGVRREGLYRGMLGFVFRFPPALSGLLIGELLFISGYDATLSPIEQPEGVSFVIRIFVALIPVFAALSALALTYLYPLHGDYLAEIEQKSGQLRQKFEG